MNGMSTAVSPADGLSLNDPSLYLDRELSLLAFQHRVLQEAQDAGFELSKARLNLLRALGHMEIGRAHV